MSIGRIHLGHRGNPGNYEYEMKWKGYRNTTWEPESSFLDDRIIKDYWKEQRKRAHANGVGTQ